MAVLWGYTTITKDSSKKLPTVALISGSGSNLQSIIDANQPIDLRAVISNNPDAYGLERAHVAGITTHVVDHRGWLDRAKYDEELMAVIDEYNPGLVVLAGFMRILGEAFVEHYTNRIINIHPSLLPKFPGLHTHKRAIESGEQEHGATVHFVIPEVDAGPIIIQAAVPVFDDDTPDTLAARVLHEEHRIYPEAIRRFIALEEER